SGADISHTTIEYARAFLAPVQVGPGCSRPRMNGSTGTRWSRKRLKSSTHTVGRTGSHPTMLADARPTNLAKWAAVHHLSQLPVFLTVATRCPRDDAGTTSSRALRRFSQERSAAIDPRRVTGRTARSRWNTGPA